MAELRISVGNVGLAMLAALGFSCGGSVGATSGQSMGGVTSTGGSGAAGGGALSPCSVVTEYQGLIVCDGGWSHRADAGTCSNSLPRLDTTCSSGGTADLCTLDTDCTQWAHGYCNSSPLAPGCGCTYGCVTDDECGAGSICVCGDPAGHCAESSCRTDADCGTGLCASYDASPGCGETGYACTTPNDACRSGADCSTGYCGLAADGHRACVFASCAIGRPLLVNGEERQAPVESRDDYCLVSERFFDVVHSMNQRQRLAEYYAKVGQMEHAAVAAFARLALQLMSLGAPSALLNACVAAQQDELEHARLAFTLASELSGAAWGPGALDISGALHECTPEHIAYTTVIEGCVGETIAALEAAELREHAATPELRAVFDQIARDEASHAQLSWRIVRWLLERGGAVVRQSVERAFDAALSILPAAREAQSEDAPFGALDAALANEIRAQAACLVITPAARELLGPRYAEQDVRHSEPRGESGKFVMNSTFPV